MKKILITGSCGLIGSEVATYFAELGWWVYGIDNNMRADFFGPGGDTSWNRTRLVDAIAQYEHYGVDIRDREVLMSLVNELRPDLVVHTAAQPSHDLAARRPFDDFDVNAVGTMNLLEALRLNSPESVFVHMSTNKVYGDAPNELPMVELSTRWDYANDEDHAGVNETMRIDRSTHSVFGASKVAADVMVQEYGRYFGMRTTCLRGGCLTGPNHSGVELHGFLSYLVKVNLAGDLYRIFGYKGKQVRDNIHSHDVARLIELIYQRPQIGGVYNLGGGRENSCSILEAISEVEARTGKAMRREYVDSPRMGDHICYISDLTKTSRDYPNWKPLISLTKIFDELCDSWQSRLRR